MISLVLIDLTFKASFLERVHSFSGPNVQFGLGVEVL